jgi:hypothetical protein
MDFMRGIGKRVTQTAKIVSEKTASVAETVKINSKIASFNEETEKLYGQIGKAYYAAHQGGEAADLSALCACVDEFQRQIGELTAQLEALGDFKLCPACGAKQAREARFCSECGAQLAETEAKPNEAKPSDVSISWPDAAQADGDDAPDSGAGE